MVLPTTEDDSVTLAQTPVADVVFTPDSVYESGHLSFRSNRDAEGGNRFHRALMSVWGHSDVLCLTVLTGRDFPIKSRV